MLQWKNLLESDWILEIVGAESVDERKVESGLLFAARTLSTAR